MFCLLVVLVKLSVLTNWLARKTPLRKPNRGEGIISRKPGHECAWFSWFIVLLQCFIMHLYCLLPLRDILSTVMARYSVLVLKVPLYPKQTNKQTNCETTSVSLFITTVKQALNVMKYWQLRTITSPQMYIVFAFDFDTCIKTISQLIICLISGAVLDSRLCHNRSFRHFH